MGLPNFIDIGVGRSGSTWRYNCMMDHPDIFVPIKKKELHFFNVDKNFERGEDLYRSYFSGATHEEVIGEVTPSYFCSKGTAKRIHEMIPDCRLILGLRDPTERAWSSYMGYVQKNQIPPDMDIFEASKTLEFDNQTSILKHGLYHQHLQRFLKYFCKDQILILFYSDLKRDSVTYIQKVYSFLGVNDEFVPDQVSERRNEGKYSNIIRFFHSLSDKYLTRKNAEKLNDILIKLRKRFAGRRPPLPDEVRGRLTDYYQADIERLESVVDRNLSHWLK